MIEPIASGPDFEVDFELHQGGDQFPSPKGAIHSESLMSILCLLSKLNCVCCCSPFCSLFFLSGVFFERHFFFFMFHSFFSFNIFAHTPKRGSYNYFFLT